MEAGYEALPTVIDPDGTINIRQPRTAETITAAPAFIGRNNRLLQ